MKEKFELIKTYLSEMDVHVVNEDEENEIVVVEDEENGIMNLVIDCEPPILVLEQVIMKIRPDCGKDFFVRLLQMNRNLVHGAFVLNEEGKIVLFRDTLQIENLDRNELEGSIHALGLALSEYGSELLQFAAQ